MATFEDNRNDYSPYGLKCELWQPSVMSRFDHHNEIEINFIPEGSLRYFFHNKEVEVAAGSVCMFWAFLPHRIIDFSGISNYYVITIPITTFLKWNFSNRFTSWLFSGEMIIDNSFCQEDNVSQFDRWLNDSSDPQMSECMEIELHARLRRIDLRSRFLTSQQKESVGLPGKTHEMVLFISRNYHCQIKTSDVARAVNLNPDYAGALFKKTMNITITDYITKERIANVQRDMLFSDDSISQIAYKSGFNTISTFNIAFKRISGMTPREYRKMIED